MKYVCAMLLLVGFVGVSFGEEKEKPKPQTATGELGAVAADSVTLVQRGDKGERSTTFKIDASTQVAAETDQDEETAGEGGKKKLRPKQAAAKLSDLKTGQRIAVTHLDGKASKIVALRVVKKKKEGEK